MLILLVLSSDFEQGKNLTEGPPETSFTNPTKPELTAPGMVKVKSDDDDKKDEYVPMLQLPKVWQTL